MANSGHSLFFCHQHWLWCPPTVRKHSIKYDRSLIKWHITLRQFVILCFTVVVFITVDLPCSLDKEFEVIIFARTFWTSSSK